ncbi:hypothetical protein [Virgibacillus ihumii]|nr:hypothetical protein [Virgibacillus ihumii]
MSVTVTTVPSAAWSESQIPVVLKRYGGITSMTMSMMNPWKS